MHPSFIVRVCFVLAKDDTILIGKRLDPDNLNTEGYWELLGGIKEENEQPLDALRRELKEETGVELIKAQLFHAYSFQHKRMGEIVSLCYHCSYDGEPKLINSHIREQHSEFRWVNFEEAKELLFFTEHREIIDILSKRFN
ncbi:MAG: NUDIX domain-containing protein [Candidatus Heimdallarchaeota archaeon]|nr:NUDIX domain-containing protein [Candidatus Heimdallarchaeota archaeon]MCK5048589.1 NUDIX domain-containing protein [Candidatus Heimdallarchaeota archaeon]